LRERDKKKPDYKKFMKRPAPLVLSPPSADASFGSRNTPTEARSLEPSDENIPWAEIIVESQPTPRGGLFPPGAATPPAYELFWPDEAPPVALLGLALLGLVLLLYFSF
jgi:hypothetical protein